MKPFQRLLVCICLLVCSGAHGQVITTVAGNGVHTNTGDGGPASAASIDYPCYGTFDKQNNYVFTTGVNGKSVRKIDGTGAIFTIAGTGIAGFGGDGGHATNANLTNPQGIAIDASGNVYIADAGNNNIRRIDHSTFIITTVAGTGAAIYSGDNGLAINAGIFDPIGLCFDTSDNLYIAEYGSNRIRMVTPTGIITTCAGTGVAGFNGDGGRADTSQIRGAFDVCSDNIGNVYIADEANGRIRKVNNNGIIQTVGGTGVCGDSGDGGYATSAQITPHDISCDKFGNLYFCDIYSNKIREITNGGTIALLCGNGTSGYSGDGGLATNAVLNGPHKIVTDTCNNLYFSDLNNYRIRKIGYPACDYLNVDDGQPNKPLTIYPNPTSSTLHIDNLKAPATYTLHDITGSVVATTQLTTGPNEINTTYLCPGIYLLHLQYMDGGREVHKIVKE